MGIFDWKCGKCFVLNSGSFWRFDCHSLFRDFRQLNNPSVHFVDIALKVDKANIDAQHQVDVENF